MWEGSRVQRVVEHPMLQFISFKRPYWSLSCDDLPSRRQKPSFPCWNAVVKGLVVSHSYSRIRICFKRLDKKSTEVSTGVVSRNKFYFAKITIQNTSPCSFGRRKVISIIVPGTLKVLSYEKALLDITSYCFFVLNRANLFYWNNGVPSLERVLERIWILYWV